MSDTRIEYDTKSGRFILYSPPWMVNTVRQIPSRRWDSKRKAWTAPALRANSRYMMDKMAGWKWSPEASDAAARSLAVQTAEAINPFPQVYKFKTKPREYQRRALDLAWDKTAYAFYMDMGTGKTKTSIDLYSAYFLEGRVDRLLILTKYSTRMNWVREFAIHAPIETDCLILDTGKPAKFLEWNTTATDAMKVLVVGTESLAAGKAAELATKFVNTSTRCGMVVDEAHMIKNHSANRSKAAVKISRGAKYRLVMTGTPVANAPLDLFMQFELLNPEIIGTGDYYSFRNRYAVMGGYEGREIVGYQNMEELVELVSPYVYQVRKSDVLTELPPKVYEIREVKLNDEQKRLYREILKNNKAVTGDRGLYVKTVLERMLRLQEVCGGVITYESEPSEDGTARYDHQLIPGKNPKIEELMAIADEHTVPTIVWCRYVPEIRMVAAALREKYGDDQVVEIHGAVSEEQRDYNVQELFQKRRARFLVGNTQTGGTGLNMTTAEMVVYYSNSFSYIERDQSEDRAHRIGQTKSVLYIDLVAEGTVDATIIDAVKNKKDMSEYVRSSIESRNAEQLFGTPA